MKNAIILVCTIVAFASAYCEIGSRVSAPYEYVGGGYLVTYDFGQGRFLKFKIPSGANIPFTIKYDFYKYEVCYQ